MTFLELAGVLHGDAPFPNPAFRELDLADEAHWEDIYEREGLFVSLEEAGLEEATRHQPCHGYESVPEYVAWFSDGEDSRYTE